MATADSVQFELNAFKQEFYALIGQSSELVGLPESNSIGNNDLIAIQRVGEPMTGIKRGLLASALASAVRRISDDPALNEVTEIGQIAIGTKSGINEGNLFVGVVSFYPPTNDSHIQKIFYSF